MKIKTINLFGIINEDSVRECVTNILETLEEESKKLPEDRKDILLNIFTDGGCGDSMFALCDTIEHVNKETDIIKIHTHILRKAYSAGFPIWLCGYKRTVSKSGEAMFHDIHYGCIGVKEEHKDVLERVMVMESLVDDIITENFKITKEELKTMREKRKDRYFSREELLKGLRAGYRKNKKK